MTSGERRDKASNSNDSNNTTAIRDNIRQVSALQDALNFEEIKLCNEMIEKLKQDNARLELTVI